jgi:hypothetical protein
MEWNGRYPTKGRKLCKGPRIKRLGALGSLIPYIEGKRESSGQHSP